MKKISLLLLSYLVASAFLCPVALAAGMKDPLMDLDDPYKFETTEKMLEFKQILSDEFERLRVQQEHTIKLEDQLNETWYHIKPSFERIWHEEDRMMLRAIRPYQDEIVKQDALQRKVKDEMVKLRNEALAAVEDDDALELREIVRKLVKRAELLNQSIGKEIEALEQLEKVLCPGENAD